MASHLYRVVLLMLPAWFREEFAAEMTGVFRATLREARSEGRSRVAALWMTTVGDVAVLGWRLHRDALRQDLSYAVRTLAGTPTFTFGIVATLAVGLGPTLVLANFVHELLIAPLPFREPDRLVRVWNARPERKASRVPLSVPDYVDFRAGDNGLSALAAHTGTSVAMVVGGSARQVAGVVTTGELHDVLGVYPTLGRALSAADSAPGAAPVILLGTRLWRSDFGGRPDVLGTVVHVDGRPTTIVGVLPDGIHFPPGSDMLWMPLALDPANTNRGSHFLTATGRLAPGVAREQAQERLNAIARALGAQYPDTNSALTIELFDLKDQLNGEAPSLLLVLSAAIGAVLLIACLNVASLLTVRTTSRYGELAVRTALGASRRRLRRQLLVEHVVVTSLGGVVGGALGVGLHRLIIERRLLPLPPRVAAIEWPAFVVLGALVLLIGIAFAWLAVRRSSTGTASALLGSIRPTAGRPLIRARQLLVGAEVAAALTLLVVGGVMLRSVARLSSVDPGFRPDGVLTFGVVLPSQDYPQPHDRARFVTRVVDELQRLPGVRRAALGAYTPMGEMRSTRRFAPTDRPLPASGAEPVSLDLPVGPGYFEVMGIELIDGRTFTDADVADAPAVLVVSEQFARETFPHERAVGKQIRFYSSRPGGVPPPTREIVGVVRDVRQDAVMQAPILQMYSPYAQTPWGFVSFFLLTEGDPAAHAGSVQRVVSGIDPMRPARDITPLSTLVRGSTHRHRSVTGLLVALAATALVMAAIGLYGVSSTAAAARTRELAIRAALGADPASLLQLILRQGWLSSIGGIVVGTGAALAATRALGTLLYETPPHDLVTFTATAAGVLAMATFATYVPARRALRTSPAEVLRAE